MTRASNSFYFTQGKPNSFQWPIRSYTIWLFLNSSPLRPLTTSPCSDHTGPFAAPGTQLSSFFIRHFVLTVCSFNILLSTWVSAVSKMFQGFIQNYTLSAFSRLSWHISTSPVLLTSFIFYDHLTYYILHTYIPSNTHSISRFSKI